MALLTLLLLSALAHAGEVAVVVGSDLKPYREAVEGFKEAFKDPVVELKPGDSLPEDVRVVVAFGGKAATRPLPEGVFLVYALAPGVNFASGRTAKVSMIPHPGELLAKLRKLDPSARRLGVIYSSPAMLSYLEELSRAAALEDVGVRLERAASPADVPSRLRALSGRVDALWAPPDPGAMDGSSIEAMRIFSWDNDVPLIVSSPGLTARGAAASIHVPFAANGRAAAQAARDALAGRARQRYYPEEVETSVNEKAAREAGLAPR